MRVRVRVTQNARRLLAIPFFPLTTRRLLSSMHQQSSYAVLGLSPSENHTPKAVKAAYLAACLKTHPDRLGGDATLFRQATAAFEALMNTTVGNRSQAGYHGQQQQQQQRHKPTREPTLAEALKAAVEREDYDAAWDCFQCLQENTVTKKTIEPVVEMALMTVGVSKAREVLAECRDRDLFKAPSVEEEAYNSLLWHCNRDRPGVTGQGNMDEILKVLDQMDKLRIQPDLNLLDQQIFTFFPN